MKTTHYNKLVRDNIPDIIESEGKTPDVSVCDEETYLEKLNEKLLEEVREYSRSHAVEELADVVEVVHAILDVKGISNTTFDRLRSNKNKIKGAFRKRLLLKSVLEKE